MLNDPSYQILLSMQKDFHKFKKNLVVFKSDVTALKSDSKEYRADIKELKTDVAVLKADVSDLKIAVKAISEVLSEHTSALFRIESTMAFYGDMYKANRDGIESLNQRVSVLEKKA